MTRALIAIASTVMLLAAQACDFGAGMDESVSRTSSLYGGGTAVSGNLPSSGQVGVSQGPGVDQEDPTGGGMEVPVGSPDGGGCLYLVGGKLILVPCPDRYDTGRRSHGDPQPWSPKPSAPVPPMD